MGTEHEHIVYYFDDIGDGEEGWKCYICGVEFHPDHPPNPLRIVRSPAPLILLRELCDGRRVIVCGAYQVGAALGTAEWTRERHPGERHLWWIESSRRPATKRTRSAGVGH